MLCSFPLVLVPYAPLFRSAPGPTTYACPLMSVCLNGSPPVSSILLIAHACWTWQSNIVGMPVAHLLQSMDATVTVCHSRTRDLASHVRRADILVAAIGNAEMVKVKPKEGLERHVV